MTIDQFFEALAERLEQGAADYGNQSMARPVAATVDEIDQELADLVGWTYVLWCQAARKTDRSREEGPLRHEFLQNLHHRIIRNDRRRASAGRPCGASCVMQDLEILAMDAWEFGQRMRDRLEPLARAIEIAQVLQRDPYRGRRQSERNPRSDD